MRGITLFILIAVMVALFSTNVFAKDILTLGEMKEIKGQSCGTGYTCGYCWTSPNSLDKCEDPQLARSPEGTYCTTCSGEKGKTVWTDNPGCAKQWLEKCPGDEGNSNWNGTSWECYISGVAPCGSRHKCQDE